MNPEIVVIHSTEGTLESAISWCMNPKSKASYHYIVGTNGKIVEMVRPENTAWHAGKVHKEKVTLPHPERNPNTYTLGIAYAGHAAKGPTLQQFVTMAILIEHLCKTNSIEVDETHILPHHAIRSDKTCPGSPTLTSSLAFVARLRAELKAPENKTPALLRGRFVSSTKEVLTLRRDVARSCRNSERAIVSHTLVLLHTFSDEEVKPRHCKAGCRRSESRLVCRVQHHAPNRGT